MLGVVPLLERFDLRQVLQHEPHFIQTLQQALLVYRIDLKTVRRAVRVGHRLRFEIDRELRAGFRAKLIA